MRRRIALIVICLAVIVAAFLLCTPSVYSYGRGRLMPPGIIRDHHGPPADWIAALVEREGGLPKANAHLTCYTLTQYRCDVGLAEPAEVYPVESWEIEQITLKGGRLLPRMLEGESLYAIGVEFRVRYADGDAALLRWETWRYGFCLGPLAIDSGRGPTGDLLLLSLGTA